MQTPNSGSSLEAPDQAQQVCTACKMRKRKCNKVLPKCSSCSKRVDSTGYDIYTLLQKNSQGRTHSSASITERLLYGFDVEDSSAAVQSIDVPTIFFLDPSILQHGQVEPSRLATPVPTHILRLLGDMDEVRTTASRFFEHIHLWMPFVSKKRFYELHLRSSFQTQPDIVLLVLSMKLITNLPPTSPRNPRTSLYQTVKHFYLEVKNSNAFSIPVLQAGVLLALYELGHAIYPAAFLSIGACARYAYALGINTGRALNTRRVLTLLEIEERRRVWWAIVILDRFVSIDCPGRPFATADPSLEDLLPADDAEWDQGIVRSEASFPLSSPMTSHMSRFALLCQAARLLGQVLDYISSTPPTNDNVGIQLDRTLQLMVAASLDLDLPDYDPITFVYSALVALHTPWLYSGNVTRVDSGRSQRAKAVIHQITEKLCTDLVEKQCFLGRNPESVSPWGLFFAYNICKTHMCSSDTTSDSSLVTKSLREKLRVRDARGDAAGAYIQLLEAQEVLNMP